jgi:glucose/arabinose dehydrogenase
MLAFGPDGYLYVGLGDGGSGGDPLNNAQNPSTFLGKILRLDVDHGAPYTVPADNPFVGQAGTRPEIWALGLRNPWRFSFDRQTGDLYIGDVGQGQWEEIDVEPAATGGRNYGWRDMEGDVCYVPGCTPAGLTLPVLTYPHSQGCSVTGGYVYRGADVPALAGLYLFADYCNGWVRSFRWAGGIATDITDQPGLSLAGTPISSFGEDGRGELYLLAYGSPGAIHRISLIDNLR